jgi:hypothetical protein
MAEVFNFRRINAERLQTVATSSFVAKARWLEEKIDLPRVLLIIDIMKHSVALVTGVGLLFLVLILFLRARSHRGQSNEPKSQFVVNPSNPRVPKVADTADPSVRQSSTLSDTEKAEIEQQKQIDGEHLKKLHAGIFAFKARYGHFPEYLSQLVPEFVTADVLVSPRLKSNAPHSSFPKIDHPDPGVAEPSYGYEFSNLEFRDGRTFAEIKEIQRAEWGNVVPLLRCFFYDRVINMAYGGDLYETALNWEWDPATLDMVDKYGWGPGLDQGEFVKVRVVKPDGSPVSGAAVWANGRNYSFDLPDRPFTTDADGYARVPVGVDIDRTALQLRVTTPGLAARVVSLANGQVPESQTLVAEAAQTVGGQVLDANGQPVADTRVMLKLAGNGATSSGLAPTLAQTRTDAQGYWQAAVHPHDAAAMSLVVAGATDQPLPFDGGQRIDPATAAQRRAIIQLPARTR